MNREQIFDYVAKKYGSKPDYPWNDRNAVLRHGDSKKWYGVILVVGKDKLGLTGEEMLDVLNVKCDPELLGSLLSKEGFHPAYHMNKELWISIRLDGSVAEQEIKSLLGMSFALTEKKGKKLKA